MEKWSIQAFSTPFPFNLNKIFTSKKGNRRVPIFFGHEFMNEMATSFLKLLELKNKMLPNPHFLCWENWFL